MNMRVYMNLHVSIHVIMHTNTISCILIVNVPPGSATTWFVRTTAIPNSSVSRVSCRKNCPSCIWLWRQVVVEGMWGELWTRSRGEEWGLVTSIMAVITWISIFPPSLLPFFLPTSHPTSQCSSLSHNITSHCNVSGRTVPRALLFRYNRYGIN